MSRELDRDCLQLPEIECSGESENIPSEMKPVFDQLANAFGVEEAFNYDENGKWTSDK